MLFAKEQTPQGCAVIRRAQPRNSPFIVKVGAKAKNIKKLFISSSVWFIGKVEAKDLSYGY